MDLALPPMPFSAVFYPIANAGWLRIPPEFQVPSATYSASTQLEIPAGVVQVIITWQGTETLIVRHYRGVHHEDIATIPGVSSPTMRSTGVLTLASEDVQALRVLSPDGASVTWSTTTLDREYVAGIQVMPMGTAADVTGGGSLLREDNSVGTRVFLGDTMIHGDTGWRDITALADKADGGTIRVRRRFDEVTMVFDGVKAPAPNWSAFQSSFPLPQGFKLHVSRPYGNITYGAVGNSWPTTSLRVLVATTAGYNTVTLTADEGGASITGRYIGLTLRYVTSDSWPTSLPGTSVT